MIMTCRLNKTKKTKEFFRLFTALAAACAIILAAFGVSGAMELVAPESKSVRRGGYQFLKHSLPVKFNVRVGAYYYWRVLFSDMATDEFYTRDTVYHQFSLKSNAPGGTGYKAVLQRKLYAWESWKNYYEDPAQYAIDAYEPIINTMEPASGIVTRDPAPAFSWRAYDGDTGLHEKPYMFMLLTGSHQPVYNSGWTADTSYKPSEPLKPGTYIWGLHVRDNDDNIAMSPLHSFSVNSSEPPKILRFEAGGQNSRTDYTSTDDILATIEASDNIGVTHYYISEHSGPLEPSSPEWVSIGKPATLYSATVPFKIKIRQSSLTQENGYSYAHKIFLWFKDYENNVSEVKTIGLFVDMLKPYNASIRINNGALYTLKREVKLKLQAVDNIGVVGYLIRESSGIPAAPALNDPAWIMNRSFEILKSYDFDYTLSDEIGTKTLFVWYRDDAGNISEAASAQIQYDTSPPLSPIIGSLGLKGETGGSYINSRDVTLILKASGSYNNQITAYYLRETRTPQAPFAEDGGWKQFNPADVSVSGEVALRLSAGEGTKEVYAWYRDNFANISPAYKCEMLYDVRPPSGSLKITGDGSQWKNRKNIEAEISAIDGVGVAAYLASIYCYSEDDLKTRKNLWNYITPEKSITFKTDIDLSSVNGERQIFLWLKDEAGNISAPVKAAVKFDCLPPVIGERHFTISKVAGSTPGYADGPADSAKFDFINGLHANAAGEIFVADLNNYRIRKIRDGIVTTFAGNGRSDRSGADREYSMPVPLSIFEDNYGNIFVGDAHLMKLVTPDGVVTRCAGYDFRNHNSPFFHGGDDAYVDAWPVARAEFNKVCGIGMDGYQNIYTADVKYIRRIKNGIVYVAAGNPAGSAADGPAENVKLVNTSDLSVDAAGDVYLVDGGAHDIRKITTDGRLVTLAGRNGVFGYADGPAGENLLSTPTSIAVDKFGTAYIADFGNGMVRILTPDGYLTTITPPADGLQIIMPQGISIMPDGSIIFGEQQSAQVKKISMQYSKGLKLLPGSGSSDGTFRIQITASDNYSGIDSYYISGSSAPPAAAWPGWTDLAYDHGEKTFEVSYAPADPKATQTLYLWLKDRAGNISNHKSFKLNEKSMVVIDEIGNSNTLSEPTAVACDRQDNIYVADSSAVPIKKFTPDKLNSKHGESGFAADRLGPIKSLVTFGDGYLGAVETARARFAFIDHDFKVVGHISHDMDLRLNLNDSQTESSGALSSKISDKFSGEERAEDFGISYGYGYNFTYEPDFYFTPYKLEVYTDAGYTQKLNGAVSAFRHPVLYVKVSGAGSAHQKINSIIASVRSTDDVKGAPFQLIETGEETNVFTGSFNIGAYPSFQEPKIGTSLDNKIYITFFSRAGEKTFTLDVTGQWLAVGENEPSLSSATYISMKIHNGVIYVAYSDELEGDRVSVVKCENNRWSYVGNPGISAGAAREISVGIYMSKPCVLYSDVSSEFRATMLCFDGTRWDALGARDFSAPKASFLTMSVAGESIFVAYTNMFSEGRASIMKYDPESGWNNFTTSGLRDVGVDYNNIVCDGNSIYFLTRYTNKAGFLLFKFDGARWVELTDTPMKIKCEMLGLKVNNGVPYILYSESDGGLLYLIKYKNGEWLPVGRGAISDGRNLFSNLTFAGDTPFVVFTDTAHGSRAVVMKFADGEWKSVGDKGVSSAMAGYTCIDCYDGEPYIVFRDTAAGERMKVLKYEY